MKESDPSKYRNIYILGMMGLFLIFVLDQPMIESKNSLIQLIGKSIMLILFFGIGFVVFKYAEMLYKIPLELDNFKPWYEWSDYYNRLFKVVGFMFMLISALLLLIVVLDYLLQ